MKTFFASATLFAAAQAGLINEDRLQKAYTSEVLNEWPECSGRASFS